MRVVASAGREDVALVYVMEFKKDMMVECVESIQPPYPREKKWVLIVSTMFGCPVGCLMCDAGSHYRGRLSKEEMFAQIDFLIKKRYDNGSIPVDKLKIQFARLGEPSFNPEVLRVLEELPLKYNAPGLMPSISTVAPSGTEEFFESLIVIKEKLYDRGRFQLQFSIHSTDDASRNRLVPVKKWSFSEISSYGERFCTNTDRKVTLNFALANDVPVEPEVLLRHFNPEKFLIKITPLNPTYRVSENGLSSYIDPYRNGFDYAIVKELSDCGYEVIVSIGEVEENFIGSNCGQYITKHMTSQKQMNEGYTYHIQQYPAV
ncbi:MAG: radical SAM protein [Proteobacteria bacterium]|nr:radical SAM protein [Pseudomonadota bacterium]